MDRPAKRGRAELAKSPAPDNEVSSPFLVAKSQRTERRRGNPPRRAESKKFVPNLSDLDVSDDAAASVHSEESVKVENSQEREDALVVAGSELTGDALRSFLQTNFVDYMDERLLDIPNLDSLET